MPACDQVSQGVKKSYVQDKNITLPPIPVWKRRRFRKNELKIITIASVPRTRRSSLYI